jgi:serine/threonine protein phosphatase PrpC
MDEMMRTDKGKKELGKLAGSHGEQSMAGCTATTVLITPTEIYCANAGDSRTVLSKANKAVEMSYDHKPDNPEERKRIYNANGFVEDERVNGMLALSRALGDFEYKNNSMLKAKDQAVSPFPDVKVVPITHDCQFILLACDGLWDCKTSDEAIRWCHEKIYKNSYSKGKLSMEQLMKGTEDIVDDCCANDIGSSQGIGCDNISAIIVELL